MGRALDWTLLSSFLAVAEAGSLSGAARATGQSQPTLGRHIRALEAAVGATLLTRSPTGMRLTPAGQALVPHAGEMAAAAARIALVAAGRGASLSGTVRISASRVVAHYLLPPMIARIRREEPAVEVEVAASDTPDNLGFREADIAVRMFRPVEPDLVTTHVADLGVALYAAPSYLDRVGRPATRADLRAMDIVGFDRSDRIVRLLHGLGETLARTDFPVRCDDQLVHWSLVRAGCGVGGMQRVIGDADPAVERIADVLSLPALPVWLTVAGALRHTPRIRRVFDALRAEFESLPAA